MVRNNELKPVGTISKQIARKVRELSESKRLSQEDLGRIIGRSQSYTSLRIKGMKSWTIEELDKLAPKLGYSDAIELMNIARPPVSTLLTPDPEFPADWASLAANHDPNKRAESETPEE